MSAFAPERLLASAALVRRARPQGGRLLSLTEGLWMGLSGGLLVAMLYGLAGVSLTISVVGLPLGLQCFRLARLALLPFRHGQRQRLRLGVGQVVYSVLWLPAGLSFASCHLVFALLNSITGIGLGFGYTHLQLAKVALLPFITVTVDCDGNETRPALANYLLAHHNISALV